MSLELKLKQIGTLLCSTTLILGLRVELEDVLERLLVGLGLKPSVGILGILKAEGVELLNPEEVRMVLKDLTCSS